MKLECEKKRCFGRKQTGIAADNFSKCLSLFCFNCCCFFCVALIKDCNVWLILKHAFDTKTAEANMDDNKGNNWCYSMISLTLTLSLANPSHTTRHGGKQHVNRHRIGYRNMHVRRCVSVVTLLGHNASAVALTMGYWRSPACYVGVIVESSTAGHNEQ